MNIRLRLSQIIEARATQLIIIALIVLNAIVLALETSASIVLQYGSILRLADQILLSIFVVELLLKIFTQGRQFYRDPWNIFDATVIGMRVGSLRDLDWNYRSMMETYKVDSQYFVVIPLQIYQVMLILYTVHLTRGVFFHQK